MCWQCGELYHPFYGDVSPKSWAGLHCFYDPENQNLPNPPFIPSFSELSPAPVGTGTAGKQMAPEYLMQMNVPPGSCQTKLGAGHAQARDKATHLLLPGKPATLALLTFQVIFKVCLAAWNKLTALEANPTHDYLALIISPSTS